MLRGLLHSHAHRVYFGTAVVLLILTPLGYTRLPRWDPTVSVMGAFCFVALSCVFALAQDGIPLPTNVKTLLAWSWGIGVVLLMTGWPWWHELLTAWVRDPKWSRTLGMADLALPGMILLPVGAVILEVLRFRTAWPERVYLLGGLCLMALFLAQTWLNLFEIWFAPVIGVNWFMAALFWMPVSLAVATLGLLFGCLPREFHGPSRRGSVMAVCYLIAAALVPLGFCAHVAGQPRYADAAALAVAIGTFAPASLVTRGWIVSRFGKR